MIGDRLTKLRNEKRLSQTYIANIANISVKTYSGYETNRQVPKLSVIKQLALFYNVTTDYLLGRTDEDIPSTEEQKEKQKEAIVTIEGTSIGDKIKRLRNLNHLSLFDVQQKTNITISTLTSYENGESKPNSENITKLCKFFNVSSDNLLGLKIENPNPIPSKTESNLSKEDIKFINTYTSIPEGHREQFRNNKEVIEALSLDTTKGDAGVIEAYISLSPEEREEFRENKRVKGYIGSR